MRRSSRNDRGAMALVPLGAAAIEDVEALVPALVSAFDRDASVAPRLELPPSALDPGRRQYWSTALLGVLERERRPEWERMLGVTDVDLYAGRLNFVFGEADPSAGVAVMSLARLHHADAAVFRRRAEVEAVHEVGHTYGLDHCRDAHCVMWFSNTLAETDRKGTRFCAAHARDLAHALRPPRR